MPSWTAENEVKLLLTVIKTNNPKISRTTWEEIASAMGKGYTYESVRYASLPSPVSVINIPHLSSIRLTESKSLPNAIFNRYISHNSTLPLHPFTNEVTPI